MAKAAKTVGIDIRLDKDTATFVEDIAKLAGTTPDIAASVMLALFWRREGNLTPPKKAAKKTVRSR